MPVSKKRKQSKPKQRDGGARSRRATSWGSASLDHLFEDWFHSVNDAAASGLHERVVAMAATLWAATTDPSRGGLNQCVNASQWVSVALERVGYAPAIRPVVLTVLQDGVTVETIGSPEPSYSGTTWSGHSVVHVPEGGLVLDATVGQGRFATTEALQRPALLPDKALAGPVAAGSVVALKREPYVLCYEFLPESVEFRHPGVYPKNQALVEQWFDKHGGDFVEGVERLRELSQLS